ncbi:hypothetical protein WUBG_11405, partial [Wuchereria bancrofti]
IICANSSPLCGLPYDELERMFSQFGENCDFAVQSQRSYSFVIFQTVAIAHLAYQELHGQIPSELNSNALPFYIAFVESGNYCCILS